MQNLELGRGFHSLQDALRRRDRYRALLRRVASPRLLAALNSWQALVEERNEQMRRLRRKAIRHSNRFHASQSEAFAVPTMGVLFFFLSLALVILDNEETFIDNFLNLSKKLL